MLDNPEKTRELVTALKAALPFEVELTPEVIEFLRTDDPTVVVEPQADCLGGLLYQVPKSPTHGPTAAFRST
jgi:hypothetical protein